MATAEQKDAAEVFKARGNASQISGNHQDAYDNYTEAIKLDGSNAIYHANRAASCMSMKRYV